jgi:hypothetical protein
MVASGIYLKVTALSMSIVPATKKAEARETLEPGSELLGTSLGNIASPCLKIKQ